MNFPDESKFSNRREFRIYDRMNFRLKQEILLRDDEIKRLKQRLENIKYLEKNRNNNIATNNDFDQNSFLGDQISSLRQQIYVETNKAEMRLTNASLEYSQRISKLNQKFNEEIQNLKQILYNSLVSSNNESVQTVDDDSMQVEQFLNSLQNIISSSNKMKENYQKKKINGNNIYYEEKKRKIIDDSVFSDYRSFDMHLYNDEIQDNEERIKKIRQLIKKYQIHPLYSSKNNNSHYLSHDSKNNYETEISLNESQSNLSRSSIVLDDSKIIQVQSKIQKLINDHNIQVRILKRKIRKEKKNTLLKRRKIEIATNQSFLTDAEIAETIKVQEKIKKKKEKKNSLKITIESLSEMTLQQREELLSRLKEENITLKREIARVDYVAYGRTGKYQHWKKLDDDSLFQCTMLFFH